MFKKIAILVLASTSMWLSNIAQSQTTVNLSQTPLLALKAAPGLVMLTMSRDHRLFYAAYNDTSDIDGDGIIDVGFKPSITYYGNFVSNRCYDYISASGLFRPLAVADSNGYCKGLVTGKPQLWSGNWLNWVSTTRMDALRRVLYGGFRVADSTTTDATTKTSTLLQGAYVPNDNHVAGHEWRFGGTSPSADPDITNFTNLAQPTTGNAHLFVIVSPTANTGYPFPSTTVAPVLRYITNADKVKERIWYWASADVAQGIGKNPANFVKGGGRTRVAATDLSLKVEACVPLGSPATREANCTGYPSASPTVWKPTGILHDYASNDSLKFGLLTGSYQNNYSGGVVRRNIQSFKNEVSTTNGTFTDNAGIARTIDRITIHGWSGSIYDCGYNTSRQRNQGECKSWGAPVAEMMYEGLRYFAGKSAGSAAYLTGVSSGADNTMGFTAPPAWQNPFQSKNQASTGATFGNPICSRPVQMVIADPQVSFDSDQLPGAHYSPSANMGTALGTSDLTGLNVSTEVDAIWTAQNLGSRNVFIGQNGIVGTDSGAVNDGNPTSKPASNFSFLRGLAPDGTQSEGSFYSAGVARFAKKTGVPTGNPSGSPVVPTVQNTAVDTIAIALGSMTPRIEFKNPSTGAVITIVPTSKAVYEANKNPNQYQATGQITGFYFSNVTMNSDPAKGPTAVSAVVNFSDSDQGTDNETDAQVQYDITLSGSTLTVQTKQLDPSPGGIQSDTGFVISGTDKDGLYLETRNCKTAGCSQTSGVAYYLDTRPGELPKSATSPLNTVTLPTYGAAATSRAFNLSTTTTSAASYIPKDVLWYTALYGGADAANPFFNPAFNPSNYFSVANPANLPSQMGKAFRSASALAAVASTSVVGVGQRSLGTAAVYQANYDSLTWSSRLYAFPVATSGLVSSTPVWEASNLIQAPVNRKNLYLGRGGTSTSRVEPLKLVSGNYSTDLTTTEQTDFGSSLIYQYIMGDSSNEERRSTSAFTGTLRNRGTTLGGEKGSVLGDIVNSDPQIIANKDYGYTINDSSYGTFLSSLTTESLAVGANDGFFHIFDATPTSSGGSELFGFMPQAARTNVKDLASPTYSHRYFVDGSIGLGHAKIAVPDDLTNVAWRSIAIGTGGAGAQTVFAINTTSQTYTGKKVLWELNANTLPSGNVADFGNVMGRPGIGKLSDGTWVAIFGNGYNSTSGRAKLFIVQLDNGKVLAVASTDSTTANGLGYTELVNSTSSGSEDVLKYVYGADYKGNIWRFDLSSFTASSGSINSTLVFSTPSTSPITAEIRVAPATGSASISNGKMIYFGTGTYLNGSDASNTATQSLYGIYDDLSGSGVNASSLVSMSLAMSTTTSDTRKSSEVTTAWYNQSGKKGWVLPLTGTNVAAGERVIAPPVRYTAAGKVDAYLFTSIVPSVDDCVSGVDAWITGVDAMTGGYAKVFDGISNANSIKVSGGSPRGVFVLKDGNDPTLYISQTVFNNTITSTSYDTSAGGKQSVTINGVTGVTQVLGIKLSRSVLVNKVKPVWRQLK